MLHAQHARVGACSSNWHETPALDMGWQQNLCCPADDSRDQDQATLMTQLTRIQQIATAWRDADRQELPPTGAAVRMAENLPGTQWLPFASQVRDLSSAKRGITPGVPAPPCCQHAKLRCGPRLMLGLAAAMPVKQWRATKDFLHVVVALFKLANLYAALL